MQKEKYTAPFGVKTTPEDKDGDGVQDNVKKTQKELDAHRKPVFGDMVNDIHNTRHGNLPGHVNDDDNKEPKESTKLLSETDEIVGSVQ
jgi:hypothetical protein